MSWIDFYEAPLASVWQGRPDKSGSAYIYQTIEPLNITKIKTQTAATPSFALIGFVCDEGVKRNSGRPGAAKGSMAIREALGKLSAHQTQRCYDAGDIVCRDENLEGAQAALGEVIALLHQHKLTPIILGGGHELAWGHYQGLTAYHQKGKLGIINFDAHLDMRPLNENNKAHSGSPFLQMAQTNIDAFNYLCLGMQAAANPKQLIETAAHYQVQMLSAQSLMLEPQQTMQTLDTFIKQNDFIYLTLCLDVFAAAHAPGVSAPQSMGVSPWKLLPFYLHILRSGKAVSFDIAELSPPFDIDKRTAKLAAFFVHTLLTQGV